jgi:transposase
MISQHGWRGDTELRKFALGAHPLIQVYVDRLRIPDLIATYIHQDRRIRVPIERTLVVLIHNILTTPMPMYEIADWLAPLDEASVGLEPGESACIHDDRVGEALERFYNGRHKDVFFHLALRAIKVFQLACTQIHQDTTSVTFSGKYTGWNAPELLTYGFNKDHRPDLKQLVLGMSVTADGAVPLTHRIYSGNQTDDRLHAENHRRLCRLLQSTDFIYVADCKLATQENLDRINAYGGRFVSVMPRTWKEDEAFRKTVRKGLINWEHLLSRRNNRKPDSLIDRYFLAPGNHRAKEYRLLWIRSSQKQEQDGNTRARHIANALEALQDLQTRLNTYYLKQREAIEKAVRSILKEHQVEGFIVPKIEFHRECKKRYSQRGRPKPSAQSRQTWRYYFSLTFHIDQEAIDEESKTDGVFPLITNLDKQSYAAKKVLEIYKFQPFLEKRHSQLKTWQEATPVLLKKDERVLGYLHMHVMALTVATLIERQLRKAMKHHQITSLPIYPENRPCPHPTLFDIVRLFRGVERYEVIKGEQTDIFPAKLSRLQREVLQLLEVPLSAYH